MPSDDSFRALREKLAAPFGGGGRHEKDVLAGNKREPPSSPMVAAWAEIPE
jgi:hypothetical protein